MRLQRTSQRWRSLGILLVVVIPILYVLVRFDVGYRMLSIYHDMQARIFQQAQTLQHSPESERVLDLQQQIADLTFQVSQLTYLREENQLLREALAYELDERYEAVISDVIALDTDLDNALIVNRGERHGARVGDAVIVGEGHVVGKVIEVASSQSTVLLLTDPQLHFTATLSGSTQPIGVTEGQFGLSVVIDLIPQNTQLEQGDVIVTSGLEEGIPQGLLIGTINRIISSDNELFKQATLLPFVDLTAIRTVSIVTRSNHE